MGLRPGLRQAGRGRELCTRQPRGISAQAPESTAGGGLGFGDGGDGAPWTPPNSCLCITHPPLIAQSRSRGPCCALARTGAVSAAPKTPGPRGLAHRARPSPPLARRGPMARPICPSPPRPSPPPPRPSSSVGQWRRPARPAPPPASREEWVPGGAGGAAGKVRGVRPERCPRTITRAPGEAWRKQPRLRREGWGCGRSPDPWVTKTLGFPTKAAAWAPKLLVSTGEDVIS